jgi:DNA-directed RNA polymerase specialized sigma24 family protein
MAMARGGWKERLLTDPGLGGSIRRVIRAHSVPQADVDDVAQDTILAAHRADLPADEQEARKYIHSIAANLSRDHMRARGKRAEQDVAQCAEADLAIDGAAHDDRQIAHRVARAAAAEFPRPFEWFWRSRALEETDAHIAEREGVSAGYVRHEVAEARRRMRVLAAKLGIAGLAVLSLLLVLWSRRRELPAPSPAPTIAESTQPSTTGPEISPRERAQTLRERAHAECRSKQWYPCEQTYNEARRLDPDGESDPQVKEDRATLRQVWLDLQAKPTTPAPSRPPSPR